MFSYISKSNLSSVALHMLDQNPKLKYYIDKLCMKWIFDVINGQNVINKVDNSWDILILADGSTSHVLFYLYFILFVLFKIQV